MEGEGEDGGGGGRGGGGGAGGGLCRNRERPAKRRREGVLAFAPDFPLGYMYSLPPCNVFVALSHSRYCAAFDQRYPISSPRGHSWSL